MAHAINRLSVIAARHRWSAISMFIAISAASLWITNILSSVYKLPDFSVLPSDAKPESYPAYLGLFLAERTAELAWLSIIVTLSSKINGARKFLMDTSNVLFVFFLISPVRFAFDIASAPIISSFPGLPSQDNSLDIAITASLLLLTCYGIYYYLGTKVVGRSIHWGGALALFVIFVVSWSAIDIALFNRLFIFL